MPTKLITTFEQACEVKGIDPGIYPQVPEDLQKPIIAAAKLIIIINVLNEDWKPNWKDFDENKYYPWWDMNDSSSPSGFGLDGVTYDYSGSAVGSRLCFKSEELARYAATQFEAIYKDYFTI